jgi:hypothetical protein
MKMTLVPWKVSDTRGRTSSPSEGSGPVVVVNEPLKASALSANCLADASARNKGDVCGKSSPFGAAVGNILLETRCRGKYDLRRRVIECDIESCSELEAA